MLQFFNNDKNIIILITFLFCLLAYITTNNIIINIIHKQIFSISLYFMIFNVN